MEIDFDFKNVLDHVNSQKFKKDSISHFEIDQIEPEPLKLILNLDEDG